MAHDPFEKFKGVQKENWSTFASLEVVTTPPAAHLVRFAGVREGQGVLDVATGTGVAALTARQRGARVSGLDLTPALLEHASRNAAVAGVDDVEWVEGDCEAMPFGDATFDVVISQFGHMFAPQADVATSEMLRVLRPGGVIAFSSWPPEHLIGRLFALMGRYLPPPPGISPPVLWGDPGVVRERLGARVRDLGFQRGTVHVPALSVRHYRIGFEKSLGGLARVVRSLEESPAELAAFRDAYDALVAQDFEGNTVRQDYLLTRAVKA